MRHKLSVSQGRMKLKWIKIYSIHRKVIKIYRVEPKHRGTPAIKRGLSNH